MESETTYSTESGLFSNTLSRKVYKSVQIQVAAFFAGPLAAAYMIARNFKQMNQPVAARKTWLYGIAAFILYVILIFVVARKLHYINYAISFALIYGARTIVKQYQGAELDDHLGQGGKSYSGWNCFGVIVCVIFLLLLLMSPYLIYVAREQMPQ